MKTFRKITSILFVAATMMMAACDPYDDQFPIPSDEYIPLRRPIPHPERRVHQRCVSNLLGVRRERHLRGRKRSDAGIGRDGHHSI